MYRRMLLERAQATCLLRRASRARNAGGYRRGLRRCRTSSESRHRYLEAEGLARSRRRRGGGARFRVSRASRSSRRDSPHDRRRGIASRWGVVANARTPHSSRSRSTFPPGVSMDLELAGKTALITGGSKGIGRATAEVFAAEGCNVIIVSRTAETLAAVKSAIAQKSNVRVDTVAADLSDSKSVDRLAQDYPDIDILVNNAGAIPGGTLLNMDETTWRKAWDLKVFGYVNMCRRFYGLMKARGRGVIVNVVGNAADTH